MGTCGMGSLKALPLYGGVTLKGHVQHVPGGYDGVRSLGSAESAQSVRVLRVSVIYYDMVIRALLVRLHFKLREHLSKIRGDQYRYLIKFMISDDYMHGLGRYLHILALSTHPKFVGLAVGC